MKVLIAEDDSCSRTTLEASLREWGYEVVTATSTADALGHARLLRLCLFVTDLNMHPCDGVELLRTLDEQDLLPGVPRLILSSAPADVVRRRMREGEVEAEVADKNGDVDVLLGVIERLCRPSPGG